LGALSLGRTAFCRSPAPVVDRGFLTHQWIPDLPKFLRKIYDAKIASGKHHQAAVRVLAYKWIHVLFRCWKDGRPYDEWTYLQTLGERNAPLKWSGSSTKLVWKTVVDLRSCPQKFLDGVTQMTSCTRRE
jgi:hypothetical protein